MILRGVFYLSLKPVGLRGDSGKSDDFRSVSPLIIEACIVSQRFLSRSLLVCAAFQESRMIFRGVSP